MAKLPFIVEPRSKAVKEILGSDESGKIEIERRGYLTVGERSFAQAQEQADESTALMLDLVRKIGKDLKMDMQKAYEIVSEVMQGLVETKIAQKVYDKYGEDISEVLSTMTRLEQNKRLVGALCMLVYRVDPEITAEDMMSMHIDLIDALADLYRDEEARSTARLKELNDGEEGTADQIDSLEKK